MTETADHDLWLRRFHPAEPSKVRLVCFPHAGGSASFYFPVSAALSPGFDVLAVQYPGRQDRRLEPCVDDIPALADQIFRATDSWADGPLALFGHSMGAVLAFEVARRIEREFGVTPVRLFASGRRAPSCTRDEKVHLRDDDGIVRELQQLSGTDARVLGDEELLRMVLPALRSDYRAIETYRCDDGAAVACPVTVLTGDADPRTSMDEARAWREHTSGEFDLEVFPGGHFFLAAQQAAVLKVIRERLSQVTVS
ncbi:thioesterase II family protein [Kitasatospora sp. NPDC008050]|uniref:thioesterase II family protein n=1 Tax=Kitasatospora sp. NPDC008050 TaxID=3364021 RepID=UPI0036E0E5F3